MDCVEVGLDAQARRLDPRRVEVSRHADRYLQGGLGPMRREETRPREQRPGDLPALLRAYH
jgi:hypothetical protein